MDIGQIMKVLPHRYPFLLVDRILELIPGEKAVGLKNVSINEQFFQGHFPGHPVMPGVLILESMAQVAAILSFAGTGNVEEMVKNMDDKVIYFMSVDKLKFRRPVVPGDQLRLEVFILRQRGATASIEGKAFVDDDLVAEGLMKAMLVDRKRDGD
jgi:beta-hydroxyacyl-ACP dehydratase FabZ